MKTTSTLKQTAASVAANDALFRVALKYAEQAGLDEIRISVPVAKEILRDLTILKKAAEGENKKTPSYFNHLDSMMEQAFVLDRAMNKILA